MHVDHQYIVALRENNQRLIAEIYARHAQSALRWVAQHHGDADDARDIFQEAVLALYDKAQNPAFVLTCPLGALLHLIYSRKWIDRLRQKKRETEVRLVEEQRYTNDITPDILTMAEDIEAENAAQSRLASTFAQISDLCRQLLRLLADGMPASEVVTQLQMNSVNTLYRRKNACMERWRELYKTS